MENKINLAELLKDCPKGMELDCTMWDSEAKVFLKEVSNGNYVYPIEVIVKYDNTEYLKSFTKYGAFNDLPYCKCVIFPKGKTTWEGFVPPCKFKDEDVFRIKSGKYYLCIRNLFDEFDNIIFHKDDTYYSPEDGYLIPSNSNIPYKVEYYVDEYFRTHEAKTLIKPKFKVGDKIKTKVGTSTMIETKSEKLTIIEIKSDGYILEEVPGKFSVLPFVAEDYWELVPDKFDITTLKPFDKVLMRSSNAREWVATFYSHKNNNNFYGCGMCCDQCIPYEGNEHLLGTTDACDEYYKNWK